MNRRKASAVVAKPSGTRTPSSERLLTISPSEEFLPPTSSRSLRPMSAKARTFDRGVSVIVWLLGRVSGARSSVSGLQALQDDRRDLLDGLGRGVDDRQVVQPEDRLGPPQLEGALLERGVARVGPPLLAYGGEPGRRGHQPEAPLAQVPDRPGELDDLEVLLDDRVVGDEQAVLQREVHRRRCLAAPRRRHQDHVGLLEAPHALAVVVLDRVLDRLHPAVVALDVADTVQPGGQLLAVGVQDRLDPLHVQVEEVDQRAAGVAQLQPDLVARGGGEHQRGACARVQRRVEPGHDLARLLDRGDERDQGALEAQVGELDEQRVAHRLGTDAGAVGQEEHRHHVARRAVVEHADLLAEPVSRPRTIMRQMPTTCRRGPVRARLTRDG